MIQKICLNYPTVMGVCIYIWSCHSHSLLQSQVRLFCTPLLMQVDEHIQKDCHSDKARKVGSGLIPGYEPSQVLELTRRGGPFRISHLQIIS